MKIYLIRHAEREQTPGRADAEQPLTRKEELQADTLAHQLQGAGDIPTLFLTSKHEHARQTAKIMKGILAPKSPLVQLDSLTPIPGFENFGSVIDELARACPGLDPSSHEIIAIVLHHPRQTQLAIMLKGQNWSGGAEPVPNNAEAICLMAASLDDFISGRAADLSATGCDFLQDKVAFAQETELARGAKWWGRKMGEVELPLVEPETSIENAIEVMLQVGRSGLVTLRDKKHAVFTIEELVEELRERGNKPLSQLQPTCRTLTVPNMAIPKRQVNMPRRPIELAEVESLINEQNADFAVPSPKGPLLMMVVTSAESRGALVGATPVLCACKDGHRYTKAQTDARNGQCGKHTPMKRIECG